MEDLKLSQEAKAIDEVTQERPGAPAGHLAMDAVIRTIWRLRQSDGCPWDREQSHTSIRKNMIEEAYEAADAIDEADDAHLIEELGDVLMQVLLHAQIAADEDAFDIDAIATTLNEKLIRRHPHVFGEVSAATGKDALAAWNTIKAKEREVAAQKKIQSNSSAIVDNNPAASSSDTAGNPAPAGLLNSVARALPALMECQKLSDRAAEAGFDWDDVSGAWEQVAQEKAELDAEIPGSAAWKEEFGDLLFSLVNVARLTGVDAEEALSSANAKFRHRWAAVETLCAAEGREPSEAGTAHLNELWVLAKAQE